ncbi:MAG TPA: phosphodiester glycosidase family protein [Leptolyngbyaceae cyanobacterium]
MIVPKLQDGLRQPLSKICLGLWHQRLLALGLAAGFPLVSVAPGWSSPTAKFPDVLIVQTTIPARSGTQVVLNGESLNLPWQVRSGRFGVADFGLLQDLGVDLLDSSSPSAQPVRWFSDTAIASLGTWVEGGYRFLDITDLAQQAGWQLQTNGNRLEIIVPLGQVQAIRRSRQDWGDRIVIDLNRPVTWGIREGSNEFTLTLDAVGVDANSVAAIASQTGTLLKTLKITTASNYTRLQGSLDATARPRISTLANPPRLVVDIRQDALIPRDIAWAPGIRWRQQYVTVSNRPFPVYWLEVDPRQPGLSLRPIWTDPVTATGIAPLITTAQRWQAVAAINAGFFNRNNQYPLGAIRREGQWISGPILSRGAVAWNDAGTVLIDRLVLNQTLVTAQGQQYPLRTVNSGYVGTGLDLYTPAWGPTYTSIVDNEVLVTVVNNQVVNQRPTGASGSTTIPIPANGYLVVIRANQAATTALSPGTQLSLQSQTLPTEFGAYPQIAAAGPLLVKDRRIVLNAGSESFSESFANQAAVRSAIGMSDRNTLLLVTAHPNPGGRGPTLSEMAQLMLQLGSNSALNLDGGSSSSLYLSGQLLNRPPSTAARVHNGIGVFLRP